MQNATALLQFASLGPLLVHHVRARYVLLGPPSAMNLRGTMGAAASAAWLGARGLDDSKTPHWYVEITIPSDSPDTRFEINIYPEEWGVVFRNGTRVSSIRVTDVAFVHGNDDHRLLAHIPDLEQIEELLRLIEQRHEITLLRARATFRSNLSRATAYVRPWLVSAR